MKICFFIDDYSAVGGIQRVTSMISSALSKDNDVHVVSMYQEHGNQNDDLYSENVKIKTLIYGEKKYIQQCFKMVKLLKEYIKNNNIDILIATSEMLSPYCFLAIKGLKTKYVVWTHTPPLNNSEAKLQKVFKRLGVKTSSLTISLTEKSANKLKEIYNVDHVTYIPNPIDPKIMKHVDYDFKSKKIITVGRICYQKYYEKLVEVAKYILPNNKEWSWDIYGDGDIENLRKLIMENGLESQIHLLGNVNDIYNRYKDYSLQVMTSRFEGFPMTLLEGFACGLPVVSFNIPGVDEIIKDKRNGLLIEPYNANKMAKSIEDLMLNEEERKIISDNNVKDRGNFSIDNTCLLWNRVLKGVIENEVD